MYATQIRPVTDLRNKYSEIETGSEQHVAWMLHCHAAGGGLKASSRPMDRTVARPIGRL